MEFDQSTGKPIGTYQCIVCERVCDGSETYDNPMSTAKRITCSDVLCGANVRRISELPLIQYKKSLETRVEMPESE
jgi:hypothetical protein